MIDLFDKGNKFSLRVKAYEFPSARDELDANWLVISIDVEHKGGEAWKACGPYLRTNELLRLLEWLRNLEAGVLPSKIVFTEGELAFSYSDDMQLAVILGFNLHPKGAAYDYSSDREFSVCFKVDDKGLVNLIRSVEKAIREFPER
ncbi:hypothetical protein C4J88_2850 [Pseudomonas sp. R4-39-08]|uniref:WapI family immunity protein n=1 Tax=Pseudomonas sp. R4-39-08 TaxID=1173288 RepID=UPI000F5788D4|nr:hypothetical protein [Pseudomonas sp. R4-39-08]AZF37632.1 hypothetical protein C4J88_2850 [Pseudomonas sp. R4-39-08]